MTRLGEGFLSERATSSSPRKWRFHCLVKRRKMSWQDWEGIIATHVSHARCEAGEIGARVKCENFLQKLLPQSQLKETRKEEEKSP